MKVQTWGFTSNLCSFEVGKLQIFEWFSIHRIMLSQHMNLNCEQNPSSAEPIHNGNAIWGILHYWDRHGPWTQKLRSRWGEFPSSFFEWLGVFARQQSSGSFLCIWIIWCFPSRFLFLLCDHLPALLAPTWPSSSLPSDPSNSCWLPKFGDIYWSMTCNSFKTVLIHLNPRLNQFESFPGSGNIRRAANVARWSFLDLKMPSSSVSLLQVLCVRRHRIQSMGTQETLNLRCWRSHVSIICV